MSCVVSLSPLTEGSILFREWSPSTASESRDKHGQHMKENRRTQEPTNIYSRMMASVGIKGLQKLPVFSDGSGHNFKTKRQATADNHAGEGGGVLAVRQRHKGGAWTANLRQAAPADEEER